MSAKSNAITSKARAVSAADTRRLLDAVAVARCAVAVMLVIVPISFDICTLNLLADSRAGDGRNGRVVWRRGHLENGL